MDPQGNPRVDFRSSRTLKFYVNTHAFSTVHGILHVSEGSVTPKSYEQKHPNPIFKAFLVLAALKSQLKLLDIIVELPW